MCTRGLWWSTGADATQRGTSGGPHGNGGAAHWGQAWTRVSQGPVAPRPGTGSQLSPGWATQREKPQEGLCRRPWGRAMPLPAHSPSPDPGSLLLRDMPSCQKATTGLDGPCALGPRREAPAGRRLPEPHASLCSDHAPSVIRWADSQRDGARLTLPPRGEYTQAHGHSQDSHTASASGAAGSHVTWVGWGEVGARAAKPAARTISLLCRLEAVTAGDSRNTHEHQPAATVPRATMHSHL